MTSRRILAYCGVLGCCGLLVLVVVGVLAGYWWSRAVFVPVVEDFLEGIARREYAKAYGSIGADWRNKSSLEEFRQMHEIVNSKLGAVRSVEADK